MREKVWEVGHRRNKGYGYKRSKSDFPRHRVNEFLGTKLGMSKRVTHQKHQGIYNTWRRRIAWLDRTYVEGLIKKYIGKPYEELLKAYHERIASIKSNGVQLGDDVLNDYIFSKDPQCRRYHGRTYNSPSYWYKYDVNDKGIVIYNPNYHKSTEPTTAVSNKHFRYNQKHPVDLGVCVDATKVYYQDSRWDWGLRKYVPKYSLPLLAGKKGPLPLGKFWVHIGNEDRLMTVYTLPIPETSRNVYSREYKKRQEYENEWKLIKVPGFTIVPYFQDIKNPEYIHWNSRYKDSLRVLHQHWAECESITYLDRLQDNVNTNLAKRDSVPEYVRIPVHHSDIHTHIRKADL